MLIICQLFTNQLHPFYYISHIVAIEINYSNLLYQSFINHYQSELVLYITSLPMITNKLPIHYYQSSIGNFLPIDSQCFANYQFTNGIGKFTNSCQWFTIHSCWQWYVSKVFFFVLLRMQKVQKMESITIQSKMSKKRDSSCVFMRNGKVQKGAECWYTDYETTSKKWTE